MLGLQLGKVLQMRLLFAIDGVVQTVELSQISAKIDILSKCRRSKLPLQIATVSYKDQKHSVYSARRTGTLRPGSWWLLGSMYLHLRPKNA